MQQKKKLSKQPRPSLLTKFWSWTSFLPSQVSDSCNSVFMVQRGRRPAPVFGVTLKKLLAHLVYFLPPHSSSSSRLNSITCFPSNSWTQELNSLFGGKCLQECGHTTEKKVLWLTIHKNVRPFFNGGTKKCENSAIWARYKKQTQVFVCPPLRIICDQFLTTGLLNTSVSVSISGASDSCCCPLPGCPLSARRWRVGGFLWCHTRSWHFSPGWQSDPGAWWQSEVELEEEKHEAWMSMWGCAADDCQNWRLWSLRRFCFVL